MVQLIKKSDSNTVTFKIDIWNNFVNKQNLFTPLVVLKSQYTKKSYVALIGAFGSGIDWTYKERYVSMQIEITDEINPTLAKVFFGNKNYPYGFYDMTIYENNADLNTDIANTISIAYQGIANVSSEEVPEVNYNKYSTNDTDNKAVYITAG